MIVCVAVVGQQNNPLYIESFVPDEDVIKFHYLVHCSLDAVEEKVALKRNPGEVADPYLGVIYPTEEHKVYGYVANSKVKFFVVTDISGVIKDEELRTMFKRIHTVYVDATSNPFYTPDTEEFYMTNVIAYCAVANAVLQNDAADKVTTV